MRLSTGAYGPLEAPVDGARIRHQLQVLDARYAECASAVGVALTLPFLL